MNRKTWIGLVVGTGVLIGLLAWLTGEQRLWGGWIGFTAGLVNSHWLFKDMRKTADGDMARALRGYRRSFIIRWGLFALFIFFIARVRPDWLFSMAVGIAGGIIISLIMTILSLKFFEKGGEE